MQQQQTIPIVCLIDDDSIYRFTAERTIKAAFSDCQIISFQNGQLAASFFESAATDTSLPDIIFLDINMPEMDGWQFLDRYQQIKSKLNKSIIIYMVSSSVDELDFKRSQDYAEVSGYLVKPVKREQFQEILSKLHQPN